MKIDVKNLDGTKVGDIELDDAVFGAEVIVVRIIPGIVLIRDIVIERFGKCIVGAEMQAVGERPAEG